MNLPHVTPMTPNGSAARLPATARLSRATGLGRVARRSRSGFTMIEIALSLAIIAFALVAIIGVLPMGLTAQRDNRLETLIDQEGKYLLEQVRSGQVPLSQLEIPRDPYKLRISQSGVVAERGLETNSVAFKYLYTSAAYPVMHPLPENASDEQIAAGELLSRGLYEISVTLRWPVILQQGTARTNPLPSNRRTFRTLASGLLHSTGRVGVVRFVPDLTAPLPES
ncbi:MAG TPA: prepilin-type N-terminal cleavage/methylation domain-containing protein [Methylomirabilota bacterium]|nr:prepilin-type N-terminal cleavage/methylation domain-containing protein [Methylomirabilota bacterium]